jgi:transposase-like protein
MARLRHRTRRDVERFAPSFCPHPECPHHTLPDSDAWRYRFQRRGLRRTARSPGIVRRFSCKRCRRSFSSSAFFDCYRRRQARIPDAVLRGYCEGQAGRQVARTCGLPLKTVQLLLRRMARQAALVHIEQLRRLAGRLDEPVVLDGLRSFAGSQWEPGDLYTAIAGESLFWLDVDYVGRRRSGAMTPRQRLVRAQRERRLGRPPHGAARRRCRRMLRRLARLRPAGRPLRLETDEETTFRDAVRALRGELDIEHHTTSSRVWREAPRHPLWPVNHEHRLARHGNKNHARETIAFSKNAAGLMDRAIVHLVWRNNCKAVSERWPRQARVTPAMRLGLTDRPLDADDLFHVRLFPERVGLPPERLHHYRGTLRSRPRERAATYRYKTAISA